MMEQRRIGQTGLMAGVIGLGTWALGGEFWGPQDEREAAATLQRAFDLGVTLFDTADVYGNGRSEEIMGRTLREHRSQVAVATKVGWRGYDHQRRRSAYTSAAKVIAAVEDSLRRLAMDYVDIVFCHLDYRDATMDNFLEGFRQLQTGGKARAFGVTTGDIAYLQEFNRDGDCAVLQVDYSILNRYPERDVLPYCLENGIGVLVRGPLAMGRLTGKLTPTSRFPNGDWRARWASSPAERELYLADLKVVDELRPLARGRTVAQLALQFALAHPAVTAVIPGGRTPRQVEENVGAAAAPALSAAELQAIDRLVPPGGGRKIWPA